MAKLKNIVKQLSKQDFELITASLLEGGADKSARLLQLLYTEKLSDVKIMEQLGVNHNAYYTLRSRLNQRIEEHLLQQVESPRTDLLRKVANINEIIFTKKRTITVATLKKLEKELIDYDLSNELTIVYKTLKRLHTHTPDYFNYSQLYNRHVAYMLSVDKAENLITDYFRKYGSYLFSQNETEKLELSLLNKELKATSRQYESHRLYVYQSCVGIFHRLFVEEDNSMEEEPIEDTLNRNQQIFEMYPMDTIYHHLRIVFEFLKLEYYNHYKVYRKAEDFFDEVNDSLGSLLSNYTIYTYAARFLFTKIERHLRIGTETDLYTENEILFKDSEIDINDIPTYVSYVTYRSICCFYVERYDEAARWLNNLLNEVSLKKYPGASLEVKLLLALQYCMMKDYELMSQLLSSVQRQIRILGKDNCLYEVTFIKLLKALMNHQKSDRTERILGHLEKLNVLEKAPFAPTSYAYIRLLGKYIPQPGALS